MKFSEDNRYEVCLPWADDISPLPDNFNLAKKRLEVTTEKLLSRNLYDKYEKVFQECLDEGIIEEVPPNEVALYVLDCNLEITSFLALPVLFK
ncbi:hypothetical protein AVEN_228104-1 [Araneus ventricosus]|uniref:Uncharacterized protein n=1 Tax=Araneus ventricosus TaxID=182803 RepID=A0A4Y2LE56_ARAVE|nr:hypothetical protein AVEN_228104-1 [Araneus ventricosus]